MYILVSRWKAPNKRPIVHCWGPYETRKAVISAKAKAIRQHNNDYPISLVPEGELTWHVSEVLGRIEDPYGSPLS